MPLPNLEPLSPVSTDKEPGLGKKKWFQITDKPLMSEAVDLVNQVKKTTQSSGYLKKQQKKIKNQQH